jgi:hypothetical protein
MVFANWLDGGVRVDHTFIALLTTAEVNIGRSLLGLMDESS